MEPATGQAGKICSDGISLYKGGFARRSPPSINLWRAKEGEKSMALIYAYRRFNGNANEAFKFYKSVLGGELTITTVGQSPMAQFMPDKKDDVFHAKLQNGDMIFLGSDMVGEEGLHAGNTMVLTLECKSTEEAKTLFAKLAEGGKVGHALAEQPWGTIGDLQDKFGTDWFVVYMPPMA